MFVKASRGVLSKSSALRVEIFRLSALVNAERIRHELLTLGLDPDAVPAP